MSRNKKITDLDSTLPQDDHYFVVATEDLNLKIPFGNLAEYSSIDTKSGKFTEHLSLKGNPALTGNPDGTLPDSMIDEINRRIAKDYSYIHFSDVENNFSNDSVAYKMYSGVGSHYPEGTEYDNPILTGVFVDNASNLKVYSIWDGPPTNYMGSGFIHHTLVPESNIKEIGYRTRRFLGYLDNVDANYNPEIDAYHNDSPENIIHEREVTCHTIIPSSQGDPIIATSNTLKIIRIKKGPTCQKIEFEDVSEIIPRDGTLVGETHLKEGDIIDVTFYYDTSAFQYDVQKPDKIHIYDQQLAQESFHENLSWTTDSQGIMSTTIPVTVANRDGEELGIVFKTINIAGISSLEEDSSSSLFGEGAVTMAVDNIPPELIFFEISYPAGQQAIKQSEKADLSYDSTIADSVTIESPDTLGSQELTFLNITPSSAECHFLNGSYNITENNFKVIALKKSNGIYDSHEGVVQIADSEAILTHDLPSPIRSAKNGESHMFTLTSNQKLLAAPSLELDSSQSPISSLTILSQGTDEESNSFELIVTDGDEQGQFDFNVEAFNLANKPTLSTTFYIIRGFSGRIINIDPRSLFAGFSYLDINIQSPGTLYVENLSEGGDGAQGGTRYFHESSVEDGTQVNPELDYNNRFCICVEDGFMFGAGGDYIFNLDKLNRAANANVGNPAQFYIRGD